MIERAREALLASAVGSDPGSLDLGVACATDRQWLWLESQEERHNPYGGGGETTWGTCPRSPLLQTSSKEDESHHD